MTTDNKKEEDNFNRIQAVIQKHGTNVQRKLIEHHLSTLGISFTNLLDKYGHELYHLCYTMYTCCQCKPLDFLPNCRIFSPRDYENLFEKDGTNRLRDHNFTRSRNCCNYAKSNISLNDLDFSLLAKVIPYCCEDLFWNRCLNAKGRTLEQFLNENKHDLYHMWKRDLPCPLCKNGTISQTPKKLYLTEGNLNCLFVSHNTPLDPSSFSAKSGVMRSQLNPHLRFSLILTFCDIIESIESLRVLRNRFAHSTDFKLTTCAYESTWCEVENAILTIAEVYGLREEEQLKLSEASKKEIALPEVELKSILQELQNNTDIRAQNKYLIQQNISIMNKNTEVMNKNAEVMNKLEDINRTLQLKYESRSWKELTSNGFQVKITANESKTNIDSSVLYFVKEDHNEGVTEDSSDSDADDNDLLRCGNCGEEFKSVKRFTHHKKTHRIRDLDMRRQKAVNTTITIKGMPRNVEEDIVRCGDKMPSSRTRDRSTAEIQIIDESLGSLVMWTKISVAAFKSKDIFLRALKEFLDKTFSYIPFEDDNDIELTVSIQIEEGLEEDDMGDFFKCGICSKEFFALAAFEYHKKKVCGRKASRRQLECSAAGFNEINENGGKKDQEQKTFSCKTKDQQNSPTPTSFTDNTRSNVASSNETDYGLHQVLSSKEPLRNRMHDTGFRGVNRPVADLWLCDDNGDHIEGKAVLKSDDIEDDNTVISFSEHSYLQHVADNRDNATGVHSETKLLISPESTATKNSNPIELDKKANKNDITAQHTQDAKDDLNVDIDGSDLPDVNVTDVLQFFIRTFSVGCTFDEFMRKCNLFPMDANIFGWFGKHENSFNIFRDQEDIVFIQPYFPNIQICNQWNRTESPTSCGNYGCQFFHICRRFINSKCPDKNCQWSHSFSVLHNIQLKDKLGISDFSDNDIKVILNGVSPSICVDYMYTSGCKVVESDKRCPRLHLCAHKLRGHCQNPCTFNKSHSTEDLHNKWVLKSCHMGELPEELVLQTVHIPTGYPIDDDERSNSSDYSQDESDTFDVDANTRENKTDTDFKYELQHESFKIGPDLSQDEGDIDDVDDYTFDSSFHSKVFSEETAPRQPKDSDLLQGESDTDNESVSSVDRLLGFKGRQSPVSIRDDTKRPPLSQDELAIGENFDSSNNDELNEQLAIALSLDDSSYESMIGLDDGIRTIGDEKETKKLHHRFNMTEKSKNILQSTIGDFLDLPETETKSPQSESAHDKDSPLTLFKQEQHNLSLPTNVTDSSVTPTHKSPYVHPSKPYYQERRPYLVKDESDRTNICKFVTKDKCKRYCRYHHIPSGMPYLWQIRMFGNWLSFAVAENEAIEKVFCDLQELVATTIRYYRNRYRCHIRFNQMNALIYEVEGQAAANEERCNIRRLTTASFVEKDPAVSSFLTSWRWYWKNNEDQWINYERDAFLFTLEKKYLTEQKTYIFFRENFTSKFKIDFLKMTQVNLDTGKVRDIIRRPLFVSRYDVQQDKFPENIPIPTVMNAPKPQHFYSWDYSNDFEFVELDTKEEEYREVFNSLQESMSTPRFEFSIIYRIQNRKLWSEFETKKKLMLADVEQDGRSRDIGERHLFHGTDSLETCYGICTNNFDFRTSGRNATMYGQGSYFAVHAEYSHSYTKAKTSSDNRIMFRSKVLVGQFTKGDPSLRRPPEIPGKFHKLYDSCVDDVQNPQMFVVFDRNQCYPEYLIMYKDRETISQTSGHSMTYALSEETRVVSSLSSQEGDARDSQSIPGSKSSLEKSKTSLRKPKSVSKHL